MSELFSRVEKLRLAKHASYRQIAAFCGVSPQNVQRWKAGGTIMPEHLNKLAEYFNTSVDYLMNGRSDAQPKTVDPADHIRETVSHYGTPAKPQACAQCEQYRLEVVWLRQTITNLQNNFAAALEKKGPQ